MTTAYFRLANGNFLQDWSDAGLITTDDNWDGVPGIVGFRGDDLVTSTGVDPRTIFGTSTVVDVIANQTNAITLSTGGVAEFDAPTLRTVALNGSGTADAPYLVFYLDATGRSDIRLQFVARDLDGSTDNAIQPINVQYRVGDTGLWNNVPGGYVADVTTGPSLATQVTAFDLTLPAAADNAPQVQVRVMTTNAVGNDEWVGIDDIVISSVASSSGVPTVNLSVSSNAGTEAGATAITVTATASAAVAGDQTVSLTVGGTNVTAGDYTLSSSLITIPAGQTSGSVTFTVVDDALVESTEAATLTLGAPSAGIGLGGIVSQNITITDNDIAPATRIADIQGAAHRSPLVGQSVAAVPGIVTAVASNGFYFQDPQPDANPATSDGLFVFTSSAPTVAVGDALLVSGTVTEFRAGGASSNNLTLTQISSPSIVKQSSGNALPDPVVLGAGGRAIPSQFIENDAGNVETGGSFDPAVDGIDFWESLEGMRVQVDNPVASSPTGNFGASEEIWVLADDGAGATSRTANGGSLITATDFNPERIQLDDLINGAITLPTVDVGARLSSVVGVVNYDFGNYEVLVGSAPTVVTPSTLTREVTALVPTSGQLTVATFNVENLDPGDGPAKFSALAQRIVANLKSPDILNLEEIQDNNGPTNNGVVDASTTLNTLIAAIAAAGGPAYEYREISPLNNTTGGEPGGNIRVAFLFNPARVDFIDRPGGTATTATTVGAGGALSASPGLIAPTDPAFAASRKPLVGEFVFNGETIYLIGNHFNSKGGDQALFGANQPPVLSSEVQRDQQATLVANFVKDLLASRPDAKIIVAGDLNDFEFSRPLSTLEAAGLTSLIETLPANARYTYNFEGNAQALDHLQASAGLVSVLSGYDVVHINSEFADQVSDHDPVVARFDLPAPLNLMGGPGRDTLLGGAGPDRITGAGGRDLLAGGAGGDTFVYRSLLDAVDLIADFTPGSDRLDLSALMALVGAASADPVADGYLQVLPARLPLPFGGSVALSTTVLFDPDGWGTAELARPLVVLVGVDITDANLLLAP